MVLSCIFYRNGNHYYVGEMVMVEFLGAMIFIGAVWFACQVITQYLEGRWK